MTKSTITREPITHDLKIYPEFFSAVCTGVKRAELRKNDRDYRVGDTLHLMETPRGSCHRTGEFINVKITHIADVGEWMPGYVLLSVELQERRKADSEPVGYFGRFDPDDEDLIDQCSKNVKGAFPLYRHAQPAPEYPEVLPCSVLLEPGLRFGKGIKTSTMLAALARRAVHESDMAALSPEERAEFQARIEDFKALIAQPAPVVPDERDKAVDADDHPLLWSFNEGWNACRAAMLKAQPQNAPQNIPEIIPGWIPVSERMPENDGAYLCWDNRYVTTYAFIFGAWQANQFIAKNITHWMPLPAAPQEVSHG